MDGTAKEVAWPATKMDSVPIGTWPLLVRRRHRDHRRRAGPHRAVLAAAQVGARAMSVLFRHESVPDVQIRHVPHFATQRYFNLILRCSSDKVASSGEQFSLGHKTLLSRVRVMPAASGSGTLGLVIGSRLLIPNTAKSCGPMVWALIALSQSISAVASRVAREPEHQDAIEHCYEAAIRLIEQAQQLLMPHRRLRHLTE